MQEISYAIRDNDILIALKGHIDSTNAPGVEKEALAALDQAPQKDILIDAAELEYISSAGLRVVLLGHKLMAAAGGRMAIRNPSEFCRSVFNATGMDSVLAIV